MTKHVSKAGKVDSGLANLINVFSIENWKLFFKSRTLHWISRITKHVSKAGKFDSGDRVTWEICL